MAEIQTEFRADQVPIMGEILAKPAADNALEQVYKKYKKLREYGFELIDSRDKKSPHGGKLEFYHPLESRSPNPGKPTIEIFEGIVGEDLPTSIFGDMLHYLPEVMSEWATKRRKFQQSVTPDQKNMDKRAYERAVLRHGESRPFEKWFEINRLDAYIRGFIAPDKADEWRGVYTPEQKKLLNEMKALLQ